MVLKYSPKNFYELEFTPLELFSGGLKSFLKVGKTQKSLYYRYGYMRI